MGRRIGLTLAASLCIGIFVARAERVENGSLNIPPETEDWPELLSETGAFKNLQSLEPETGILAYEPNLSFWSDHARKRRWFYLAPDKAMVYRRDRNWTFPEGAVWIKHFDLDLVRGDPSSAKRIETRFLLKTPFGVEGVSYRWNEEGTEATLVGEDAVEFDLPIVEDGEERTQRWIIPSRSDCVTCHSFTGGYALSFNTRQLNRDSEIEGEERNLLGYLSEADFFEEPIENPHALPRFARPEDPDASLDLKARSYLAVNCVNCHQPGGTEADPFDVRPQRTLEFTGLIDETSIFAQGSELKIVDRGDPENSSLYRSLAGEADVPRMPPLASNEIDQASVELVRRWIAEDLADYRTYDEWAAHWSEQGDGAIGDPSDDPDGDGDSNRREYLNQTSPLSGKERSHVQLAAEGDAVRLAFEGGAFADYRLEGSDDLQTWQPLPDEAGEILTQPEDGKPIEAKVAAEKRQYIRIRASER